MIQLESLKAKLLKVDSDPMGCGLANTSYRNPDGPEAVAAIETLEARFAALMELAEGLELKIATLFDAIKHGDNEHREWLLAALRLHFKDGLIAFRTFQEKQGG